MRVDPAPRVISSASEKSFSLALKRCMRVNGNGKPVFPVHWGIRCFMQMDQRRDQESGSNKDPSAALGMTIREEG